MRSELFHSYSKAEGGMFPERGTDERPRSSCEGRRRAFEMTLGSLKRGDHNSPSKEPSPSWAVQGICLTESCSRGRMGEVKKALPGAELG